MRSRGANFAATLFERIGENSCLIDAASGETLSGLALAASIRRSAGRLLSSGLQPGDRLLVACDVGPESALCYLAAMYAGIVPVPIESRLLGVSGELINRKARARAIWTVRKSKLEWAESEGLAVLQGSLATSPELLDPSPCSQDDLAALMPTSGSTGLPRLVMVSHGNLRSNTEAIIPSQRLGADERAMLIMPISYCFGASVLHTHLYQGGGVVFDSRFMLPDKVLHAINQYKCTSFAGVPTVYNILLRRSNLRKISLPGLRRLLQAGGALDPESVAEMSRAVPNAAFFVMYGQTEATARISCLPPERLGEKLGSAGAPLGNLEVRLADEHGDAVVPGQVGEVQVRGPSICSGYFEDADATSRKFVDGWLHTGDYASRDDDGYLWIKGRSDDFIKIRGVRVSVAEVEARVARMVGVTECAAMGVKHPEAGEALAVLVVPKARATEDENNDFRESIRRELPPHWTCVSVKVVKELPRTTNGKIARSQLAAML